MNTVRTFFAGILVWGLSAASLQAGEEPLIIAHRGASGYLPEHTLEAVTLAFGLGADYIEQDLVVSKDDRVVVLHDIHLDAVTDVAKRFPGRARADGKFYAIDFTLAELKTLRVHERKGHEQIFPTRFSSATPTFQIPTLREEIDLIRELGRSLNRPTGIYPEIKQPAFHRKEGKDISVLVLAELRKAGYAAKEDAIYLQCFDAAELKRIRTELGCSLKLVQLLGEGEWKGKLTERDLQQFARYADGIGPSLELVFSSDLFKKGKRTGLIEAAHRQGLFVHPYTHRVDALPAWAEDNRTFMTNVLREPAVDGLFTDFPDQARRFVK
ncbi:MAG: glycerophosphodiester phosphodiesterase [Verrucomicrobiota bacterium]